MQGAAYGLCDASARQLGTKLPVLARRAWRRAAWAAGAFFFAGEEGEGHPDHLVEVVRRDPAAASWFIEVTMLYSAIGGMIVSMVAFVFLSLHWSRCGHCDRPLRWWLLLQAVLQIIQIPVRVVLLLTVRAAVPSGRSLEARVASLTSSPAWRLSKKVSMVLYASYVLGLVWWMHSQTCDSCPGIHMLTASVLLLSAGRAAVALFVFWALLPPVVEPAEAVVAPKVEAATPEQILALGLTRVTAGNIQDGATSCAVCLCDFGCGDLARRLPCEHFFHHRCIDKWLQRNKRCPLCMQAIDNVCELKRGKTM